MRVRHSATIPAAMLLMGLGAVPAHAAQPSYYGSIVDIKTKKAVSINGQYTVDVAVTCGSSAVSPGAGAALAVYENPSYTGPAAQLVTCDGKRQVRSFTLAGSAGEVSLTALLSNAYTATTYGVDSQIVSVRQSKR